MFYTPPGQKVAVLVLRERGAKLTYAALGAQEPMVGLIRFTPLESSANMAYHARSELALMDERSDVRCIAKLSDPEIYDWNQDGLIFRGWVLESDPVDNRLQQLVQMWWVRPLETLPAKPEIRGRGPTPVKGGT